MVYRRSDLASGRAIVIGEMPGLEAHSVERKLAAIFAADVEGYSRLMGLDEVGTLRTLTAYRVVIDRLASGVGSIAVPPATPAPRNGPIERPAASNRPREGSLASRQAPARGPRRPGPTRAAGQHRIPARKTARCRFASGLPAPPVANQT